MNAYSYQAVDPQGRAQAGALSAISRAAALNELNARGLTPLELVEAPAPGPAAAAGGAMSRIDWQWSFRRRTRVDGSELLQLTQALASLVRAGLTVDRALAVALNLVESPQARALITVLGQKVRAGASFARALADSSQPLPGYYISMVDAGEAGGGLAPALTRLAELLARQLEMRRRIVSALVYPSILAAIVLLTLVVLLAFVLPRFEQLFVESGAELPFATRLVLGFGRMVADYGLFFLIACALGGIASFRWLSSDAGRRARHRWLLRSRMMLGLPASVDTARLLRTVSTLLANGQPLPSALRLARGTLSNLALRDALDGVIQRVNAGENLHQAITRAVVFPPVASQLARVGEETGKLDELLLSAAIHLEERSSATLDRLLNLMVPVLTIGMGLIVAALIGSVLVGLLSINDLAY
jgi:general secretion pathway protein F